MPHGSMRIAVLLAIMLLAAGCASNDLMVKRQTELEARVEFLHQTMRVVESRINDLAAQIQANGDKTSAQAEQLNRLQASLQDAKNARLALEAKVQKIAESGMAAKIEVVNPEPSAPSKDQAGPPQAYLKAFGLYSANSFQQAIDAFEAFMKENPSGEYAPNALYWIGECNYSMSRMAKAREIFAKVAESYPKSSKAPDAMLKLAFAHAALKEDDKAKSVLESLIKAYPSSGAAIKARERLTAN